MLHLNCIDCAPLDIGPLIHMNHTKIYLIPMIIANLVIKWKKNCEECILMPIYLSTNYITYPECKKKVLNGCLRFSMLNEFRCFAAVLDGK